MCAVLGTGPDAPLCIKAETIEHARFAFRNLQDKCETISPAVLNQRLKELQAAGLVHREEGGYAVTQLGREVYEHLVPLGKVAKDWAASLENE